MECVRHIATSWSGSRVAVAAFERRVAVWDVASQSQICEFETDLDFGGRRLAITSNGERVVAGAYHRSGIACYDASSGATLWRRKDLKKLQHVTMSAEGDRAYCGFERRTGRALDMLDGSDAEVLRGVAGVHVSPYGDLMFIDSKSGPAALRSRNGRRVGRVERTTFAFLSIAFDPDHVLTSESGGPVRCHSARTAEEVWRYTPPTGTHAQKVAFNERLGVFLAVTWPFVRGGRRFLSQLEPSTGEVVWAVEVPESPEYGFCSRGTLLLTWDGSLLDTETGDTVSRLGFPSAVQS
jgi:outer membrane protein assembly factor BamB